MNVDLDVERPWPDGDWWNLAARAAEATAAVAPELSNPALIAGVLYTSDEEVRRLNRDWRGKDEPTNVLSFPMLEQGELIGLVGINPTLIGDVALAHETCAREAAEKGLPLEDHAAHLIVHGLLHLAGYDHEISPADADAMEALETKALALMGVADPYGGAS